MPGGNLLLVAPGSRGDVGPYVGLGLRLVAAGHHVTVCTHAEWQGLVESHGLGFRPLYGDSRAAQASEGMQQWQEADSGVTNAVAGSRMVRDAVSDFERQAADVVDAARDGIDVVLPSVLGGIAILVADALGLPSVPVHLGPTEPTGAFPPPGIGLSRSLGRVGNRAAFAAVAGLVSLAGRRPVARLRAELGVPAGRRPRPSEIFYGYSEQLLPRPRDWRDGLHVVGFWWSPPPAAPGPAAEIETFLQEGAPPVFVSFGSMAEGRGAQLSEVVTTAVRLAGCRAIVQAGWAGLSSRGEDVLCVDGDLDHAALFPRTAAVVHHGGVGTTASALRAGVPQVPVPMAADQPFWGHRVERIGVGPAAVPFSRLDADRLAHALRAATGDRRYADRAGAVGRRVRAEDGAAPVVAAVGALTG